MAERTVDTCCIGVERADSTTDLCWRCCCCREVMAYALFLDLRLVSKILFGVLAVVPALSGGAGRLV